VCVCVCILLITEHNWDVSPQSSDSGLKDGFNTARHATDFLVHIKCQRSVAGHWGKSFNPQWHWSVYPLAPDRPHLAYKSARANLLSCLKMLHKTVIVHFSLQKTLQSGTEETSSTCYPCRLVEIWLRIFKSQWKHAIFYLWVSYLFFLTFAFSGDKLFEIIFRSFHAFFCLWNFAATSDNNHSAGTHNSGSYKCMSCPI
jgi:hypothetical protein